MNESRPDIKYLFEPRTIAVVGASHDQTKIGFKILENIVKGGYKGKIYPINPKGGEILGYKVYKTLEEVPGDIDLATISVPAKFVFDSVQSCAAKNVKFMPIITSGFSEVGNIEEEKKIVAFARDHKMRVLGPNIFGVYSAASKMNATFGPAEITDGSVAIITQSGALGLAMIGKTAIENIGLSAIVSVGNKADVDEADLLEYLIPQEKTKIILMYIEGVKNGEKLVKALKRATAIKPVIVIKTGRSEKGAIAAASHTGSLAGSDDIFDDVMKQCGVLRAESVKEAFNWCKFLSNSPLPKGDHTVIITNGGGIGVMATDACEKYDVDLYDDLPSLKKTFSSVTPDFGSVKNPIDLTGQASASHYQIALDAALDNKEIHSVISLYCETALFDAEGLIKTAEDAYEKYKKHGKPIVFSFLGGEKTERCISELKSYDMSSFNDVYEAVNCLGALYSYRHHKLESHDTTDDAEIDVDFIESICAKARSDGRTFLLAHEAQDIVKSVGVHIPQSRIAKKVEEAVKFAEEIGFPVVMKVVSRDILHKSDAGGIALDLQSKEEVIDAYQAIIHNCKLNKPDAFIEGIEVAEMVRPGTETIIGARKDKAFGPIVMFGFGGIYVEVMKDVSFRAVPINRKEALDMLKETRSYPILLGVRGEEKKDIDGIIDKIIKVGAIIRKCPSISDIEINPLRVYENGEGVKAVDVRIILTKTSA